MEVGREQRVFLRLRQYRTQRFPILALPVDNPKVSGPFHVSTFVQVAQLTRIGSGAWLVLPSYMIYVFARDILHGLSIASGDRSSKPARAATPTKEE